MISLYKPALEDLWFRQKMMADPQTMSYNRAWGGTIPFPESDWPDWYRHWVEEPEGKRFYRYLTDESGTFLGEIAYHLDEERGIYVADVIVFSEYRGRGTGRTGLLLLCDQAADSGIEYLYDDIASDNTAIKMFLDLGFEEVMRYEKTILLKKDLRIESGTCLYRDDRSALYTRDGSVFFTESGRSFRLSSHPYEPCLYMTGIPDGSQTVIHNAFEVSELTAAVSTGQMIRLITGDSYDGPGTCSLLGTAAELSPGEYDIDYIECRRFLDILMEAGAVSAETALDLAPYGLENHRIMDRMLHAKYAARTESGSYHLTGKPLKL